MEIDYCYKVIGEISRRILKKDPSLDKFDLMHYHNARRGVYEYHANKTQDEELKREFFDKADECYWDSEKAGYLPLCRRPRRSPIQN
jgi:hypothetical protein